jgi:pyruvate dehydrogenase E1 component
MRWNAMAMVVKANRIHPEDGGDLGGHISSFASLATMLGAGFNHFWHAETPEHGGDCLYIQGHSAPGIYARAFLEGRITEEQLLNFRQEVDGKGLSSYPHPKLMPEFWQFPTVSMGLGPLMAHLPGALPEVPARPRHRQHRQPQGVGLPRRRRDGRSGIAGRHRRGRSARGWTTWIFVVNCNLQRLDGPVRGNGKIIQELEGEFRGAGWNVIKLVWGSYWDPLLARDRDGVLRQIMMQVLDGDYQAMKANDGAFVRKRLLRPPSQGAGDGREDERRGHLAPQPRRPRSAEGLCRLPPCLQHKGQPTVLLVKTVKGFGMGKAGEGRNIAHQAKKLADDDIRTSATASTSRSRTTS